MVEYVFSNIFVQKILKTKSNLLQKKIFFMRIGKSFDLKLHQIQQIFIVQENFSKVYFDKSNSIKSSRSLLCQPLSYSAQPLISTILHSANFCMLNYILLRHKMKHYTYYIVNIDKQ